MPGSLSYTENLGPTDQQGVIRAFTQKASKLDIPQNHRWRRDPLICYVGCTLYRIYNWSQLCRFKPVSIVVEIYPEMLSIAMLLMNMKIATLRSASASGKWVNEQSIKQQARPRRNIKTAFPGMWISIMTIRRSWDDRLVFTIGIGKPAILCWDVPRGTHSTNEVIIVIHIRWKHRFAVCFTFQK